MKLYYSLFLLLIVVCGNRSLYTVTENGPKRKREHSSLEKSDNTFRKQSKQPVSNAGSSSGNQLSSTEANKLLLLRELNHVKHDIGSLEIPSSCHQENKHKDTNLSVSSIDDIIHTCDTPLLEGGQTILHRLA
jgi:hypothetical protein